MAKNALTVNQAMEQLTAARDNEARAAILNNCTVVQIRRITGDLKLSVPGKLRKSELIQAIIQTMHTPEAEPPAPMNNTPAINSSSTDNPLQDVETPAPIQATSPLQGDVTGTQLHAEHGHNEQKDVKQIHPLAVREKTLRRTNAMEGEKWRENGTQKVSTLGGKSGRSKFYLGRHIGVRREALLTSTMSGKTNRGMVHHVASSDFKIAAPLGVFLGWVRIVYPLKDFKAVLGRLSRPRTSRPERHTARLSIEGDTTCQTNRGAILYDKCLLVPCTLPPFARSMNIMEPHRERGGIP